jgi:putative N6-adenine-specific DNA methylase
VLSGRFATWTSHFITADLTMPRGLGLKPQQEWRLKNGALDCKLFSFAAQDV